MLVIELEKYPTGHKFEKGDVIYDQHHRQFIQHKFATSLVSASLNLVLTIANTVGKEESVAYLEIVQRHSLKKMKMAI